MTTPTELADLVRRTAAGPVDELPGVVAFGCLLDDVQLLADWRSLHGAAPPFVQAIRIARTADDGDLENDETPRRGEQFRISIQKRVADGELCLLFSGSLSACETAFVSASVVRLACMDGDQTFTTHRNRIEAWTLDATTPFAPSELLPDPRAYSVDFTGRATVPADLRPWLRRSPPVVEGEAYQGWAALASRRLLAGLANQVSGTADMATYRFTGPPSCSIVLTDAQAAVLLEPLTEGATWVFVEGSREADTRHLLLSSEWARTYRKEAPAHLGADALKSAQAAYSAYVKAGSRETLKALADLRKAVVEESQKISQRAQDLATGLWKDVAIAAAPFVLKILPDAAKIPNRQIAGWLAIAAAVFLIFSFSMQAFINHRYFLHQDRARDVWRTRLVSVLLSSEIDEFSKKPIEDSVKDYEGVRNWVALVYFILVVVLVSFGFTSLTTAAPVTATPTPPAAKSGTVAGTGPQGPPAQGVSKPALKHSP